MKQIIPFKKELLFKTKVSEITSISLEHTLTLKNDDLISGEFHISGDYKMTEGSINREKFEFSLPFDIALDSRYDISSIIIDIDNFYYEIINNESLQVNIDVYVDGEKIEDNVIVEKELDNNDDLIEEKNEISLPNIEDILIDNFNDSVEEREAPIVDVDVFEKEIETNSAKMAILEPKMVDSSIQEFGLFDNIDSSDTYVTYYVYVVKEEDTIDKIMNKYQVTKEDIELYNSPLDIKPGTKLIIPSNCNE